MSVTLKTQTSEYILDKDYEINIVNHEKTIDKHTHQFVEFVYTLQGKALHIVDGREYHVKSGDMLIINYHCSHSIAKHENLKSVDIMLKPEYVNETLKGTEDVFLLLRLRDFSDLSNSVIRDNVLLHFDGKDKQRLEFLIDWTAEVQNKCTSGSNLIMYSALQMILSLVFEKMTENQNTKLSINDILLSYIRDNCQHKLPINDIAAKCGYSPEHFSRIFKNYTGKSPMDFLIDSRIEKAKNLLLNTEKSIETILSECGFSNRTAFFKSFSKRVGYTPLQYRKNQK